MVAYDISRRQVINICKSLQSLAKATHNDLNGRYSEILKKLPKYVKVVEVGPRDGLQNEKQHLPASVKIELIQRLMDCGLPVVEMTSFVSPKWVPQLSDAKDVVKRVRPNGFTQLPVLTPNTRGFENAVAAGATEIAVFASASESFSRANINCSIDESLRRYEAVCIAAKERCIPIRGYVSCCIACPEEGPISPRAVARVAKALYDMGCYEISLGDTIGAGTPATVVPMLEAVLSLLPRDAVAVHFHDTHGNALANIFVSLQLGISAVDSSIAGLGGCPYAKGSPGNVATEDVVCLLHGLGVETGVDVPRLLRTSEWISRELQHPPKSRTAQILVQLNAGGPTSPRRAEGCQSPRL